MTTWLPDLHTRTGPRYLAIADALADAVRSGQLATGERLPTQRELADRLGLTLGTVTRAYAQAEKRGLIRGEVGRGTFVSGAGARWDPILEPGRDSTGFIDMGPNLPLHGEDPDLAAALADLSRRRDLDALMRYNPPAGTRRHREAGAAWLARHGTEIDPDRVVVTAGAQHAIMLLLSTLCRPGDTILVEPVTYPGVRNAASLLGLKLQPVAVDAEGLLPEALDLAAGEGRARVLYCMPTLQNPTSATMSEARRDAIAEVCRSRSLRVIEDDVHGLLAAPGLRPLSARLPERSFHVAGTSKLLSGGLRIAFVAAPEHAVPRLSFAMAASMWLAPPLMAELAAVWIQDGTADAVVERKRTEAAARVDLARRRLEGLSLALPDRSYFAWLELPDPWTGDGFADTVRERGVAVSPASAFAVRRDASPTAVRISLSAPGTRREVADGLDLVRAVLDDPRFAGPAFC